MELPKKTIEFNLPAYNEEKILAKNAIKLYNYLKKQKYDDYGWIIKIVVNGSSDKSKKIAKELSNSFPKIKYFNITEKGRGNALKKSWLNSQADIIVYMDIDLAVSLKNIPHLLEPILKNDYDLTVGSRLLPESKINRSFIRELSSQTYNFLSKIILGHNFSDLQCGFKAIKRKVFLDICPYIKNKDWFFDTELIIITKKLNYKIKEIPIDWKENRYNTRKSKVNIFRDSTKFIWQLINLKIYLKNNKKIKEKIKKN